MVSVASDLSLVCRAVLRIHNLFHSLELCIVPPTGTRLSSLSSPFPSPGSELGTSPTLVYWIVSPGSLLPSARLAKRVEL